MRYLITGHTGFKGSWLTAMLKMQGHEVAGISLDPDRKSHFNLSNIERFVDRDYRLDIRNKQEISEVIKEIQPEVVVHLAAQPLVRESYRDPIGTYETNVIGTLNVLEATKESDNLKATLVITTDKVYKNKSQMKGYLETDELGGEDPYSSSKAAADLATQSWRRSFAKSPLAIARAGNVIGGGDYSKDRIVADLVESLEHNKEITLRNPEAIRPWQHVLDCLSGYQKLIEKLLSVGVDGEWNFGPEAENIHTVSELVETFQQRWGSQFSYEVEDSPLHEASILLLNSNKSREQLGWQDKLNFQETIDWTVSWYKNSNKAEATEMQIKEILSR
jgi:CDP-glucose 4,6-dehydratase